MKLLLLTAIVLTACSGELDLDDQSVGSEAVFEAAPEAVHYGLIVLNQTAGEDGVSVSGLLLDFEGVARADAVAALATPDDAWRVGPDPAPQTCRRLAIGTETFGQTARIDVLDAGLLRVRAPHMPGLLISPRALPPVVTAIAGVVYDADAPQALPPVMGTWRVDAPGAETGPILGEVEAPEQVGLNTFEFDDDGLMVTTFGGDAIVQLSRVRGSQTVGLACGIDSTPLRIDWATLAYLGEGLADIAVMKVRRAPLLIDGADAGDLLFVARDADELYIPLEY